MKIVKKAVEIGNGAAVYVPKEYSGKEVVVLLPEGVEEIKKRVLSALIGFMSNIVGVYLYGSYARDEQNAESDIDILIITQEKDENIKMSLKDIDARVVSIGAVRKSIKNFPLFIIPILKESKALINPNLLEELKNSKFDIKKLKWNFEDIKRITKIIEDFIELDDKDIASSHVYSLIMRIRVCYLIECLLKNIIFSNASIRELLFNYGLKQQEIEKFFNIYRQVREGREINIKVEKEEILRLIKILEDYSKKLEHETKKKIEKRN